MKPLFKRTSGKLAFFLLAVTMHVSAHAQEHAPVHANVALDQNAPAFAEAGVRAITGTWNPHEMMKRAAPEIMTPFVRDELPHAYARLNAKLGTLKTLSTPVTNNAPPTPGKDPMRNAVTATVPMPHDGLIEHYVFNAEFTTGGPARVEIVLRYRKQWQIVGLHIDSPLLPQ
jgi:hypothetical protein